MTHRCRSAILVGVSLLASLCSDAVVGSAGASQTTAMATCSASYVVRPTAYVLGCGSGTYVLTKIHWSRWGQQSASASATYVYNICSPTCAADHNVSFSTRVTATQLEQTPNGPIFKKVTLHYAVAGRQRSVTWTLPPFS